MAEELVAAARGLVGVVGHLLEDHFGTEGRVEVVGSEGAGVDGAGDDLPEGSKSAKAARSGELCTQVCLPLGMSPSGSGMSGRRRYTMCASPGGRDWAEWSSLTAGNRSAR